MFVVILKATNSSIKKGTCKTFCRSIHVKKVMKLPAFIFQQPWYADSPKPLLLAYTNYGFKLRLECRLLGHLDASSKDIYHSEKSDTIRKSNHVWGVCKEHNT